MAAFVSEGITERNLHALYADPYIQRVGHDHRPAAPIFHPSASYISCWVDDEFAGAFLMLKSSQVDYDMHALLLKAYRLNSRDLGKLCADYVFNKYPLDRITAPVIEGNEGARNYCQKIGFKQEGFKRDACIQNGMLKGIYIMGLTRSDWSKSWVL